MNLKRIKFSTGCVFNGADYKPGETAVVDGSEKGLDVVLGAGFAEVLKEEEPDDAPVMPSQFPPLDVLEAGDADSAATETEDEPESDPEEKPVKTTSKKRKKK